MEDYPWVSKSGGSTRTSSNSPATKSPAAVLDLSSSSDSPSLNKEQLECNYNSTTTTLVRTTNTPTTSSGTPAPPRITPFGRPARSKGIQPPSLSASTSSGSIRAGLVGEDDSEDPDIVQDGHENRPLQQIMPSRKSFPLATVVPTKRRLASEVSCCYYYLVAQVNHLAWEAG